MYKEHRLSAYIFFVITLFILAVWIGGYGNAYIGIVSFIGGCLMIIAGIVQLNKMDYAVYGSILMYLSVSSIDNYKANVHSPLLLFHKYSNIRLSLSQYIETRQNVLIFFVIMCIIVCIICIQGDALKMTILWDSVISFIVSIIGYLFLHDWPTAFCLFASTIVFLIFHSILSMRRSAAFHSGVRILTLMDMPFLTVHYINGHYKLSTKYCSEKWKKLPLDVKKENIKNEIKAFAQLLSPGKYLIETHGAMIHLLTQNLPSNVKISKSKKYPAIFNKKARKEFKAIYGEEEGKQLYGSRKVYVWYFELTVKQK